MRRRRNACSFGAVVLALAAIPLAHAQTQLPETVYTWPMGNASQNATMASLAGIANRNTNGEVLLSPNNGALPNPRFWLDRLKESYPQVQSQQNGSISFYINRYRPMIDGYVYYDRATHPHSINVATSIAGVTNAIIVDATTESLATSAGLTRIADARSFSYSQVYNHPTWGPQFNRDMLFHQDTTKDHQLRDFATMNRGFTYYTNPTQLNPYAGNQNDQGRIFGWAPSEVALFTQASQNNQQTVASDWNWSSSTTAKWRIPLARQTYHPPGNTQTKPGKHYVAFVMSDGDNCQWLTGGFATDPKWFGSPHRGNFNMTWDLTSTLADMNPVAFNYLYSRAANGPNKDNFISSGGSGLTFPSQYPDINALAADINASLEKADQRAISILDTAYSQSKLFPILEQEQVTGMMFKTYADFYKGRNGAIDWHDGKPILSVKYSLWDGADSAQSIAAALNAETDIDPIDNASSYSIVNVHPWSTAGPSGTGSGDPMSNLNALVQLLNANKVEVVGLEELMLHLRNHFGTPVAGARVTATWIRDGLGGWSARGNWSGATPDFVDTTVNFGGAITAPRTIGTSAPVTVGSVNFDNPNSYTIGGSGAITFDVTSGQAGINVLGGSHSILVPVTLADDTTINVAPAGSTLALGGPLTADGVAITKTGAGRLDVRAVNARRLAIDLGSVRLIPGGTAATTSKVETLDIAGGASPLARLDLSNNALVVDHSGASPLATIKAQVGHAYHEGAWDEEGITSGLANASTHGVAYAEASELPTIPAIFGAVDADAVLVRLTRYGDADLDGTVNLQDFNRLAGNFGSASAAWSDGDFTYDGDVNLLDFNRLAANFGLLAGTDGVLDPADWAALASAVPEPAWLSAIVIVAAVGRPRRYSPLTRNAR